MYCIKTNEDIDRLRNTQSLDNLYLDHIERYFLQLFDELSDTGDVDEFSLDDYGYMVILQAGDNVRDLKEVGLNPEENGLLGCYPEFVDIEPLDDGRAIYKIGVLYNNEYMMVFFSELGQFSYDPEIERWLKLESEY